jgi:uncharacterized protein (DUF302 family)
MSDLAFEVTLDGPFDAAIEKVGAALKEQGFGILTRIDVKATLKEKIDVDFRPYVILGACNPSSRTGHCPSRPDVGLLLPCNVTVEQSDGGVDVKIADPEVMMTTGGFGDDATVAGVAAEARCSRRRRRAREVIP